MKVFAAAVLTLAFAGAVTAAVLPSVAINEVDYQNPGTDTTEWIELVGTAGADLTGWSIVLINQANSVYGTYTLAGSISNDFTSAWGGDGGFYVLGNFDATTAAAFPGALDYTPAGYPATNAIQNGPDDVIQLYDAAGNLVDEWEYDDGDSISVTGQSQPVTAFDSAGTDLDITTYSSLGRLGYSFDLPYFVFDDTTMTGVNRFDSETNNVLSGNGPAWTAPAYTGAAFSTVGPYTEAEGAEIAWSGTASLGANRGLSPGTFNNASYGAGGQDPYTINIIPEPATLALMTLGGLALLRRRG